MSTDPSLYRAASIRAIRNHLGCSLRDAADYYQAFDGDVEAIKAKVKPSHEVKTSYVSTLEVVAFSVKSNKCPELDGLCENLPGIMEYLRLRDPDVVVEPLVKKSDADTTIQKYRMAKEL